MMQYFGWDLHKRQLLKAVVKWILMNHNNASDIGFIEL